MNKKALDWLKTNKNLRAAGVTFAGLLCANILMYFIFLMPAAAKLKELEDGYSSLRKTHAEAVLFQKQKQELSGIKAGIPTQKDMPLLVKELGLSARRLRLSTAGTTYDIPKQSKDGLTMLSFSFPAEGSYTDIKRFIYEIETSSRLIAIEGLELGKDQGRVRLQMKLMTYIKGREK